jgi:hypothetical protein
VKKLCLPRAIEHFGLSPIPWGKYFDLLPNCKCVLVY